MSGTRPRAVVCGYGEMATIGLECLAEAGYDVPLLVTHADDPHETIWWRSPAAWAQQNGLAVRMPADVNDAAEVAAVEQAAPDFLFSFYYRAMLRKPLLALPRRGALNLHGSLLPRFRGRAPINWALVKGETTTGVTLHYMDIKPDHGDIVDQESVPIAYEDTARTLFDKAAAAARELLRRTLPALAAGTARRIIQDHAHASYYGRRTADHGRIEWRWSAYRIYNLVRAVTHPYPGAFAQIGDRRLFIWWATPTLGMTRDETGEPGTVLDAADGGVRVACGEGVLVIRRAQLEDGPEIAGAADLKALLPPGTMLS